MICDCIKKKLVLYPSTMSCKRMHISNFVFIHVGIVSEEVVAVNEITIQNLSTLHHIIRFS